MYEAFLSKMSYLIGIEVWVLIVQSDDESDGDKRLAIVFDVVEE